MQPVHSLCTLRSPGYPGPTQHSVPAGGQPYPDRIGYLLGRDERFRLRFHMTSSSPRLGLAHVPRKCLPRHAARRSTLPGPSSKAHPARVAGRALDADAAGAASTDRYQVVLHVDAEVLASPETDGRCELEDGPALAPETARRLACDGSAYVMAHGPAGELTAGRKTRVVSTTLRRALRARDGTRCTFPGCGCRGTDAHHVNAWAEGGPTMLSNLITLCKRHHTFVHEGGFRMEPLADGRFRFLRPDGRELVASPAPPEIAGDAQENLALR